MRIEVEHWDVARDGPLTENALRHKLERRGYTVSHYTYPPGTRFPPHNHDCDKLDAVLAGRFRLVLGDVTVTLEAGDCLYVPKGVTHSAEVVGRQRVISLDGVRS
jgi:mannose-6-phosphate isomerase-like protein (cupin superfamily)